jgi:CheY-like chemotaxis protein
MDIRLPKINGYDATQRIKEMNPSIPVIAVTAYAHSQGIIDCYNSGCDDFIAKPFDIKKIIRLIENYLVLRN